MLFKKKLFGKNERNSSLSVTCVARGECEFRHTTLCDKCKNNMGMQKYKSYFEPKGGGGRNVNFAN